MNMHHKFNVKPIYSTRLVCPCCNLGVIAVRKEEDKFIFPSDEKQFLMPVQEYPSCTHCKTDFKVTIDRKLKIFMEIV